MKNAVLLLAIIVVACSSDKMDTQFKVDSPYQATVDRFYVEAEARGWPNLPKNNLIVRELPSEEAQEPWETSRSNKEESQWVVQIHEGIPTKNLEIPVFREMAHILMGKEYAPITSDDIMNPHFSPYTYDTTHVFSTVRENYLDKLFKK